MSVLLGVSRPETEAYQGGAMARQHVDTLAVQVGEGVVLAAGVEPAAADELGRTDARGSGGAHRPDLRDGASADDDAWLRLARLVERAAS